MTPPYDSSSASLKTLDGSADMATASWAALPVVTTVSCCHWSDRGCWGMSGCLYYGASGPGHDAVSACFPSQGGTQVG